MARKKNPKRKPIPNHIRVRMCRQKIKEKQQYFSRAVLDNSDDRSSLSDSFTSTQPSSLRWKLREWVVKKRVARTAVDALLAILVSFGINGLPKNHRTLLGTPVNIETNDVAGGELWYNGLQNCLTRIFSGLDKDISISLNFNIDGLPLFKSSKTSFWPILASIHGMCD